MKYGSDLEVSYGAGPDPDWRAHKAAHPELDLSDDEDSEDATPEEKAYARAILGFDPDDCAWGVGEEEVSCDETPA